MRREDALNLLNKGFIHSVKDPLWGNIPFTDALKALLDTAAVEKLSRIKQNGPAYHIYPGAVHTRLSHSIGVYHIGREMLLSISRKSEELPFTAKGMIKKTAWSEYAVGKQMFQGVRLNEGDRLIKVQPDADEEGVTVFFVTKGGMCLNAQKDDIPVQGRVSGGVKGINLKEGDEVVFVSQIDGEGEIVLVTSDGRFKRVIAAQIDPLPRYRKGVQITSLKGESILFADYVTNPYLLAVAKDDGTMTELSTEDVPIDTTATRGRPLKGVKWKPTAVFAMKYREVEDE